MQYFVCTDKHHLAETGVAQSVSRNPPWFHLLSKRQIFQRALTLERGSQSVQMTLSLARVQLQHAVFRTFLGKSDFDPHVRFTGVICLTRGCPEKARL